MEERVGERRRALSDKSSEPTYQPSYSYPMLYHHWLAGLTGMSPGVVSGMVKAET